MEMQISWRLPLDLVPSAAGQNVVNISIGLHTGCSKMKGKFQMCDDPLIKTDMPILLA
jgi:hypothetical protein